MSRVDDPSPARSFGARRTQDYQVAGRIVRPHGVRGAVVLEAASDMVEQVGDGQEVFLGDPSKVGRIVSLQPHGRRYLLTLEGVSTRQAADALRGTPLLVRSADLKPLPEGVYYRWQIVGLHVLEEDGRELGKVVEVLGTGANDVYEVERSDGRKVLLPAISSVVRSIDLDAGVLRVLLPAGLLDSD